MTLTLMRVKLKSVLHQLQINLPKKRKTTKMSKMTVFLSSAKEARENNMMSRSHHLKEPIKMTGL